MSERLWKVVRVFSPDTVERKKFVCVRDYEPGATYRYIWQKSDDVKLSYVIYRAVHAALMLILLLISFFHIFMECPMSLEAKERYTCIGAIAQVNPSWPFYLTRWGLMLNFAQSLMGLILVAMAYCRQSPDQPDPGETRPKPKPTDTVQNPRERQLSEHRFFSFTGTYWGLHTVATTLTFLIDVLYWTSLNDYSVEATVRYINFVSEHAINFVLMVVDCIVVAFPILMLHVVHLVLMGAAYTAVTLVYYFAGGLDMKFEYRYLYPFLDWGRPLHTCISLIGVFSFGIGTTLVLMLLDFIKHKKFRPRPSTTAPGSINSLLEEQKAMNT